MSWYVNYIDVCDVCIHINVWYVNLWYVYYIDLKNQPLSFCSLHSLVQSPSISPGSDTKTAQFRFVATGEILGGKKEKEKRCI